MPGELTTLREIEDDLVTMFDTLEGMEQADPLRAELEALIAQKIHQEVKKVDNVTRAMAHFENQMEFAAAEIKRLQARKQRNERALHRLEAYVQTVMEAARQTKLEGQTSTLALHASPASIIITNIDLVPAKYRTIVPESFTVSRAAGQPLAKDLKAGVAVPGAELSEGNTHVVRS